MKRIRLSIAVTGLCLMLLPGPGAAGDPIPAAEYARINAALLESHVLPRYQQLASAAAALAGAAGEFCAGNAAETDVRRRYHEAMDAWMGVQHLRFGPVELFMRAYRLYFWPQARGRVGKALDELLGDPDALSGLKLSEASVAIQGLPAIEHLLYARDAQEQDGRCLLLMRIAAHVPKMAGAIVADWRGGDVNFKRVFSRPGPDNAYYDTHRAATLDLFKSFHAGLRLIADVKLKPVLGDDIDAAQPRLAESRLSGRAMRNIVANLEALQALYLGDGGEGLGTLVTAYGGDPKLDPLMQKAFRMTIATAKSIDRPLVKVVTDAARRETADKLLTQVLALKQIVRTRVADALGLGVGFNALDGD